MSKNFEKKRDLWKATNASKKPPKDGIFLKGTIKASSSRIVFGVESYFVQEGQGREIEQAMRRDRDGVVVELNVAADGKTAIKTVKIRTP